MLFRPSMIRGGIKDVDRYNSAGRGTRYTIIKIQTRTMETRTESSDNRDIGMARKTKEPNGYRAIGKTNR